MPSVATAGCDASFGELRFRDDRVDAEREWSAGVSEHLFVHAAREKVDVARLHPNEAPAPSRAAQTAGPIDAPA